MKHGTLGHRESDKLGLSEHTGVLDREALTSKRQRRWWEYVTACFHKKTSGKNKRKEHAGKTQASKTLANKDRIVSYIQMQNGAGTSEIATQIELSDARTRVLLAELISEGRIYLEGNGRARRYYVPMKS